MVADSGKMALSPNQRFIIFSLYNGYNYVEDNSNKETFKTHRPFERMSFREEHIKFSLESFDLTRSNEEIYKGYQAIMNIHQLSTALDSLQQRYDGKQEYFSEGFRKRLNNYENRTPPAETIETADTTLNAQPPTLNTQLLWPLADHLDKENRTSILDAATNAARNAKENVSFNKQDLNAQQLNIKRHKKEWHKKFTLSFACLIFFFIGAPLGTIIRKGGLGLPVVISVLFFVIYYIVSTVSERMAEYGDLNMFLGVWLSSLLLFPIGLFLTFKATSDSSLLDGDSWKKFFHQLFHKKTSQS